MSVGFGADSCVVAVLDGFLAGGFVGDEVKDAANAFRVVLRARVGDDLDALEGVSGHHLKHLRRVGGEHRVRLAVDVYFKGRAAVDGDIVLGVDCNHRDLAEHIEHSHRLAVYVFFYVVGHLVDFHFDELTESGDAGFLDHLLVVFHYNIAEIDGGALDCKGLSQVFLPEGAEGDGVTAVGKRLGERAFFIGDGHLQGSGVCGGLRARDRIGDIRFALAGCGIEDFSADRVQVLLSGNC